MRLLNLLLIATATTLAACGDDNDDLSETRVRLVNAAPAAGDLDLVANGVTVAGNVEYGHDSGYEVVNAGHTTLVVQASSSGAELLSQAPTLANATSYTLVATGLDGSREALFITDDLSEPDDVNRVKFRIIHAAPSAGNVDIWVTSPGEPLGAPTASNVGFGTVSPYYELPDVDLQVRMAPTGTHDVIIDTGSIDVTRGEIRTVVARDGPAGGAPFGAIELVDREIQ